MPGYGQAWLARLCGTGAQQMLMLAVAWQMYEVTNSAWDLGLVGLFQFLPSLALTLPAGHAADRYHRGRVLAASLGLQALAAVGLAVATLSSQVDRNLLLAASVLLGVARAFQMPAQQSLLPSLVPPALLPRALAFGAMAMQAAVIGGPALGGLLYAAGAAVVYAGSLILLAMAALLALRLPLPPRAPGGAALTIDSMLAGFRYVARHRPVLGAMSLDLFAVLLGGATALLPIFAKDILHLGPAGLGLLRGAPALGALLVSVLLSRWPLHRRTGAWLFGSVALYGLAMLGFGLSTLPGLSWAFLAIGGGADMVSVIVRQTLVQLETPDEMRGRVAAVNSIFIGASNQLGEFESGATAAWLGPVGSVVLGGLGTLGVVAVWMIGFPELRRRDHLTPPAGVPQR